MRNQTIMRLGCAIAALAIGSSPAIAQQAEDHDVLVMKRKVAIPTGPLTGTPTPTPTPTPAPTGGAPDQPSVQHQWTYGEWSDWSSTCSADSTRTRESTCVELRSSGPVAADPSNCDPAQREPLAETSGIYSGCKPSWDYGEWGWNGVEGAKSSNCSAAPQQYRTATCLVLTATGEETRPDAQCGPKSTTRSTTSDYSGCTYKWVPNEWSDWNSSCSENATRTRTSSCIREQDGVAVTPGNCEAGHPDSRTSETGSNMISCGGALKNGSFESGFTDWSIIDVYSSIVTDARTGTKAAHLSNGAARVSQTANVTVPSGAKVTYTFGCKMQGASNNFRAQITGPGFAAAPALSCGTGSYTLNTFTYTATQAGTSVYVRFYGSSTGGSYSVLIDDVTLTVE